MNEFMIVIASLRMTTHRDQPQCARRHQSPTHRKTRYRTGEGFPVRLAAQFERENLAPPKDFGLEAGGNGNFTGTLF
jgi:hypothetical protein